MRSHKRFSDRHSFRFSLLVDTGNNIAQAYGARVLWNLIPRRTVVGIDKAGRVIYYKRGRPSADAILAAITSGEITAG